MRHDLVVAPREPLAWATLDAATFARATSVRRFIVMDGAAERSRARLG